MAGRLEVVLPKIAVHLNGKIAKATAYYQALGKSALPVGRTPAGRTARKSRPCCDRTAAASCDLAYQTRFH
jgi:hypothetical protein